MRHTLGPLLRDKRIRKGLAQVDLAEMVGLSKPHMSLVENGAAALSADAAMRVAEVLGLDGRQLAARFALEHIPQDLWPALFELLACELAPEVAA